MNQRIKWIDYLKGFLILTVMLGHTLGCPKGILVYIYSFHMPLFFLLSGYTMSVNKYTFKEFFKKKFKTLIIPGIIFTIPISIVEICFLKFKTFSFKSLIKGVAFGIRGEQLGIPWFLVCLFISEILLYIIIKGVKNYKHSFVLIIMLSIANYVYLNFMGIPLYNKKLPYCIDVVGMAMLFIYIGYIMKENKFEIKRDRTLYMISFFVVSICTCILNYNKVGYRVDFYTYAFGSYILFMLSAISGSFALIMLFKKIRKAKILEYIGKNSLIYYIFHYTLFVAFTKILLELGVREAIFSKMLSVVYVITGIIFIIPVVEGINLIKSKKLKKIKKVQQINTYIGRLEN